MRNGDTIKAGRKLTGSPFCLWRWLECRPSPFFARAAGHVIIWLSSMAGIHLFILELGGSGMLGTIITVLCGALVAMAASLGFESITEDKYEERRNHGKKEVH